MPELTLEQANELIAGVFREAERRSMPPLAVAVLDAGGHLRAMQRQNGVSFMRAEICQAKAWGALALGVDSRELAARITGDANQQGFIQALNAMSGGRVVPLPGGVLIRDDDDVVLGAIGVAGAASDQDEACARAAIDACGLRASRG